jgi:DNA-binding transcriptional regulator YhcF (GntR family)
VLPTWTPVIPAGAAPLYERLVAALRADIASGALSPGVRLPPQRDLAYRLGVGLGTVTRAYVEAEKAGLVSAHVGRGSFVNAPAEHRPYEREGPINLAQNIAPAAAAASRIAEALARLRRRADLSEHLAYAPPAGHESQRRAGAAWLSRTSAYEGVDWRRLICCAGAQQGLSVALSTVLRPGDVLLTEALAYHGLKALTRYSGWRTRGLPMDAEGLRPDALEAAVRATGVEARVARVGAHGGERGGEGGVVYARARRVGEPPHPHRLVRRRRRDQIMLPTGRHTQRTDREHVLAPRAEGRQPVLPGARRIQQVRHVPREQDRVLARAQQEPIGQSEVEHCDGLEMCIPGQQQPPGGDLPQVKLAGHAAGDSVRAVGRARHARQFLRRLAAEARLLLAPAPNVHKRARPLDGQHKAAGGA